MKCSSIVFETISVNFKPVRPHKGSCDVYEEKTKLLLKGKLFWLVDQRRDKKLNMPVLLDI